MTWKATLLSVIKDGGNVRARCELTDADGFTEIVEVWADDLTISTISAFLGRVVASRRKRNTAFAGLMARIGQDIAITEP